MLGLVLCRGPYRAPCGDILVYGKHQDLPTNNLVVVPVTSDPVDMGARQ